MSVNLPTNWKPEKSRAIDILVTNPSSKIQDISEAVGVSKNTIRKQMR